MISLKIFITNLTEDWMKERILIKGPFLLNIKHKTSSFSEYEL